MAWRPQMEQTGLWLPCHLGDCLRKGREGGGGRRVAVCVAQRNAIHFPLGAKDLRPYVALRHARALSSLSFLSQTEPTMTPVPFCNAHLQPALALPSGPPHAGSGSCRRISGRGGKHVIQEDRRFVNAERSAALAGGRPAAAPGQSASPS